MACTPSSAVMVENAVPSSIARPSAARRPATVSAAAATGGDARAGDADAEVHPRRRHDHDAPEQGDQHGRRDGEHAEQRRDGPA